MSDFNSVEAEVALAAVNFDLKIGVGQEVEADYCDCDSCKAQSRLRRALDAYVSSVMAPA